ncbi:hypothetical protein GCM10010428_77570 [Actinosynnema pretiosum subsp. pretiosum]
MISDSTGSRRTCSARTSHPHDASACSTNDTTAPVREPGDGLPDTTSTLDTTGRTSPQEGKTGAAGGVATGAKPLTAR